MRDKYTNRPFTLLEKYHDKFGSNAFKFEDDSRVLLCTHTNANENDDHVFEEDWEESGWGEVSIHAFNTDEEYYELHELAENPDNRIYIRRSSLEARQ